MPIKDEQLHQLSERVNLYWDHEVMPTFRDFLRIPNKSPDFDPDWESNGNLDAAAALLQGWVLKQPIHNITCDIIREAGKTPLLLINIPANCDTEHCTLFYGHHDKQPEATGWSDGLSPWEPVERDNKLYGRGSGDDGYAIFSAITALVACQAEGIDHGHVQIIIEGCEESGSADLAYYLEKLDTRIKPPHLIICLDSGCGNYDQLWVTSSLRGMIGGTLGIETLTEGIHSGRGSGVVPAGFDILKTLLNRIQNTETHAVTLASCLSNVPEKLHQITKNNADTVAPLMTGMLPWKNKTTPVTSDKTELLLNMTWRAQLSVTGMSGLPSIEDAGNVTQPHISAKLSMRLPPNVNSEHALSDMSRTLLEDPPHNAHITFQADEPGDGWYIDQGLDFVERVCNEASDCLFNMPCAFYGEGGSIPFMNTVSQHYPSSTILVLGVLGPGSNAHGPNEFLHIPFVKKLTTALTKIINEAIQ